ncbi:MAG: thioredoxin domain-containing protein, partial [Candidatus Nanohaloarchaea archaeon]|nr:thioredoxin domain-containing protein [Candidatus Nanohaloarchaea archaeon]
MKTVGTAAVALLALAGLGYLLTSTGVLQFSTGSSTPTGAAVAQNISSEGEPVLGNASAPVTVTVFEDFECPVCKRFDQSVMPRLKSEYVETGKLKVVWKDFPLAYVGKHPWSDEAAIATECVYR